MNILKSVITLVPTVIGLFKKDTPNKGNDIAKAGKALLAAGGTGLVVSSNIPSTDEITNIIVAITQLVSAVTAMVGAIAIAVGKSQTKDNPDDKWYAKS